MKPFPLFCIALITAILCMGETQAQINMSSYWPSDPKTYCRRTFEWTFGKTGLEHSEIIGAVTVPYLSEPLSGSLICGMLPGDRSLGVVDEWGRNLMDGDHYPSTDCSLTSYPEGFPETIEDGMWLEISSVCDIAVNKGLADCQISGDADDAWWFRIQDVTVQGRLYPNSIVIWIYDHQKPFLSLHMHGKDTELGITPPAPGDPIDPLGRVPDGLLIFADGIGLIVSADIGHSDVEGERQLVEMAELVSISCHEKAPVYDAFDFPGTQITSAQGTNNSGDIVGYYSFVPEDQTSGFVRDKNGNMTTIHFPGSVDTFAHDINNRGDIIGSYLTREDESLLSHGFLLKDGSFTTLDVPGASWTEAFSINDAGDIVGYYRNNYGWHGFLFSKDSFEPINFPGKIVTVATGMNNHGDVVGWYWENFKLHGFIRKQNVFETIDFPDALNSFAFGINDAGVIVGACNLESETSRGFLFERGDYTTLQVPCAVQTFLYDISASGKPVGEFSDKHGYLYGFSVTPSKVDEELSSNMEGF